MTSEARPSTIARVCSSARWRPATTSSSACPLSWRAIQGRQLGVDRGQLAPFGQRGQPVTGPIEISVQRLDRQQGVEVGARNDCHRQMVMVVWVEMVPQVSGGLVGGGRSVVVERGKVVSGGGWVGGGTIKVGGVLPGTDEPGGPIVVGVGKVSKGESARSWVEVMNFPGGILLGSGVGKLTAGRPSRAASV